LKKTAAGAQKFFGGLGAAFQKSPKKTASAGCRQKVVVAMRRSKNAGRMPALPVISDGIFGILSIFEEQA